MLKDDKGFMNLNWFNYFRLKLPLENFTTSDKIGKTPLAYISCVRESFKRIKKGSSYYRRILLTQKS